MYSLGSSNLLLKLFRIYIRFSYTIFFFFFFYHVYAQIHLTVDFRVDFLWQCKRNQLRLFYDQDKDEIEIQISRIVSRVSLKMDSWHFHMGMMSILLVVTTNWWRRSWFVWVTLNYHISIFTCRVSNRNWVVKIFNEV